MEIHHNRQCQKPEASNARSSGLHCIRLTKKHVPRKKDPKQFSVPPRVAEKTRFFSVEKVGSLVVWWFGEVRLPHEISQKTKVSCRIATLDPFFIVWSVFFSWYLRKLDSKSVLEKQTRCSIWHKKCSMSFLTAERRVSSSTVRTASLPPTVTCQCWAQKVNACQCHLLWSAGHNAIFGKLNPAPDFMSCKRHAMKVWHGRLTSNLNFQADCNPPSIPTHFQPICYLSLLPLHSFFFDWRNCHRGLLLPRTWWAALRRTRPPRVGGKTGGKTSAKLEGFVVHKTCLCTTSRNLLLVCCKLSKTMIHKTRIDCSKSSSLRIQYDISWLP